MRQFFSFHLKSRQLQNLLPRKSSAENAIIDISLKILKEKLRIQNPDTILIFQDNAVQPHLRLLLSSLQKDRRNPGRLNANMILAAIYLADCFLRRPLF